ncbi:MAG: hypothetical protein ACK5P5_02240 [Pseudobdellovibrionaceae bacterium]
MDSIRRLWLFIKKHLKKFLLSVLMTAFFLVVFFPTQDLIDLITSQVSFQTQKKAYIQMDSFGFSLIPVGLNVTAPQFEWTGMPAIKADSVEAYPSVFALIGAITNPNNFAAAPVGDYLVEGLFKGSLNVKVQTGKKTENGNPRTAVDLVAENLALEEIKNVLKLKLPLKGSIHINSSSLVDLSFSAQPEIQPLTISIDRFSLGSTTVNTQMGAVGIPELSLKQVKLEGRLIGSKFIVDQGIIGSPQDELNGTVKGSITVNFVNQGGVILPQFNGYNFDINLKLKRELEDRAQLFLILIDRFKSATDGGHQYKFKVSAPNTFSPPQFDP